jgi:glucokinase
MPVRSSRRLILGLDVGGTFTKAVLIDGAGKVVARDKVASLGFSNKKVFEAATKGVAMRMLGPLGRDIKDILSVGVGVPGPVDFDKGIVLSLTNIRGWDRFPLADFLRKAWRRPVFVENDANCMALAEARAGAGRGCDDLLGVTLGTGVGGGLVLGGKIYRGPFYMGGEIGHIPVAADGPACGCGGVGCLERMIGNAALQERVRVLFQRDVLLEETSRLAREGDARALKFWAETGEILGRVLAGVVHVVGSRTIIIGGGVAEAGEALFQAVRASFARHAMKQIKGRVAIKKAALGNEAGMLGAAWLAKEEA